MTEVALPPRERILRAAIELLDDGGIDAVSTRAVTARAGVQAPAIYRLFGDKLGLLDAAAEQVQAEWVREKGSRKPPADPVEALRRGWDDAIRFGLDHPAAYRVAQSRMHPSPAILAGQAMLAEKIRSVDRAGRLIGSPDLAAAVFHAAARGVTLTLLDTQIADRDLSISAVAREAILAAITRPSSAAGDISVASAASQLKALLPQPAALEPAEDQLLSLWLDRLAHTPPADHAD